MSNQLRGKKYSGTLYGRKYGTEDVFVKLTNATEITTSVDIETDVLPSTGREDYGQAIEAETTPGATQIKISGNTFDKHALARALMGEAIDLEGTAKTLSETAFGAAYGGWIDLGVQDIDPANFNVKNGTDTVEPAKYELNPRLGMIRLKDDAGIAAGAELKYSGKTKGTAGFAIDANTMLSLPLELKLDGKDRISGKDGILYMPHAKLTSDGDINWMSDDWMQNGLSGTLVKDEVKPTMRFTEFG